MYDIISLIPTFSECQIEQEVQEMKKIFTAILALCLCLSLSPIAYGQTGPDRASHWEQTFYVDEFGDYTDDSYIRGIFTGTFTNSATSGEDLEVIIFIDDVFTGPFGSFDIRLLEYGFMKVNYFRAEASDIIVKVKIGDVIYQDTPTILGDDGDLSFVTTGKGYIKLENEIFNAVIEALDAGEEISFLITANISDDLTNTYRFKVDPSGLEDIPHDWTLPEYEDQ